MLLFVLSATGDLSLVSLRARKGCKETGEHRIQTGARTFLLVKSRGIIVDPLAIHRHSAPRRMRALSASQGL